MKKIVSLASQPLKWEQPRAFKMEYNLRAGDELVATLNFRSLFGSLATGQSADGCWTFKRVGFWQTRATIRACDSEDDIASYRNNTWSCGGTLELVDGQKILGTTNFWQTKFGFERESGEKLIQFTNGGLIHISAIVEVLPEGLSIRQLPWMVMLGWYLVIMMHHDAAIATGAATAT
jgi:hypothetical protein